MHQILTGIFHIHMKEIAHRDLKPENILLSSEDEVKICDFGLIRSVEEEDEDMPILTDYIATRWYRAP